MKDELHQQKISGKISHSNCSLWEVQWKNTTAAMVSAQQKEISTLCITYN